MVKIYALNILYRGVHSAVWLKSAYDLSSFGFFQRGSVQEFMAFVSKTIVERTSTAARQSVKEGGKRIMAGALNRPSIAPRLDLFNHTALFKLQNSIVGSVEFGGTAPFQNSFFLI